MQVERRRPLRPLVGTLFVVAWLILAGALFGHSVLAAFAWVGGRIWVLLNATGGFWRVLIAAAMGVGIAVFGIGLFRQFAPSSASSDDYAPADVPARFGLGYLCEVCGLELSVIRVARPEAPKHCGEPMVVIQRTPG